MFTKPLSQSHCRAEQRLSKLHCSREQKRKRPSQSGRDFTWRFGMCGILGIFDVPPNTTQSELRKRLIECARRLRHRGPDWSGYQLLSRAPEQMKKSGSGTLLGVGANSSTESLQRCVPPPPPLPDDGRIPPGGYRGRTSASARPSS